MRAESTLKEGEQEREVRHWKERPTAMFLQIGPQHLIEAVMNQAHAALCVVHFLFFCHRCRSDNRSVTQNSCKRL